MATDWKSMCERAWDDAEKLTADQIRSFWYIEDLERALRFYSNCRHACVGCFCTKEARAVLEKKP
jgi:hypothetical protein